MSSARWEAITRIFEGALDIPLSARAEFVRKACGDEIELESEVLRLLAADERAGSFLESPVLSTLPRLSPTNLPSLLKPGSVISGRFEILRLLGQGGMGQVYEAFDLELKGRIALKAIRPDISSDPRVLNRFRREVQLTRRVTHPNVCRTFDIDRQASDPGAGVESDITFLTMELLEGETLADLLRREGRLGTAEALPLVRQMIEGLNAAHKVGIIHRDFKPSNVLLVPSNDSCRVVVTDFGLARAILPEGELSAKQVANSLTDSQALLGTLVYMAPEQLERGEATVASDIYALGLVMYEMVTGQRPFTDPIPFAEAVKRIKQPAPSPKLLVPDLEPRWEAVICKCLEAEPEARFENVLRVAEEITPVEQEFSVLRSSGMQDRHTRSQLVAPASPPRKGWRKRMITIVVFVAVVSLSGVFLRHYIRQSPIQFAERDWILVADFNNQTGEKVFDRVVRDLTVQSLNQSSYLNVVPRLTELEAAKRTGLKEVNSIDDKLGRELCLRENYKALLSGDIFKQGSQYVVAMKVEVSGRPSSTVSDSETIQSPDEIFAGIDRLTLRLRRTLGESVSRIETNTKPLAHVTTSSLKALQRYSTALDLYDSREYTRSIALANDAVDIDPNFAMAHLLLGRAYEQMGDEIKCYAQLGMARAGADHVSEREKHLIQAAYFSSQLANEKAADAYQHLLDIYPDDVAALRGFAEASFWSGHPEEAIRSLQRALRLSPNDVGCYDSLMTLLVRANQFQEALAVYEQARLRKLDNSSLNFVAALAAWGQGDLRAAQRMFDSLGKGSTDYWKVVSKLNTGKLLGYQGRVREAINIFREGLILVQRPGWDDWVPVFQYQLAKAQNVAGKSGMANIECRKYGDAATAVPTPGNLERAGRLFVKMKDLRSAKKFRVLLEKQMTDHRDAFSQMELLNLAGDIDLASGRIGSAVRDQNKALAFLKSYEPYLSLGEACEQLKDWKCAIDAYNNYIQRKGEILRDDVGSDWTIAHYLVARAYLNSGNRSLGIAEYQQFIDLFSAADADLPILLQAKREFPQLGKNR